MEQIFVAFSEYLNLDFFNFDIFRSTFEHPGILHSNWNFEGILNKSIIFLILLGTPDAPSMSLSVDNKPLDGKLAVVRHGQMIDLKCTSKGGNPVTSLSITKNGTAFGPEPKPFLNSHSFMVTKRDNKAFLGCKSENQNEWHAESWPVELNVLCKFCMTL